MGWFFVVNFKTLIQLIINEINMALRRLGQEQRELESSAELISYIYRILHIIITKYIERDH